MIVSDRGDHLLLVRQVDHQEQCGAMARAWGNSTFHGPPPFAPIEVAAAVHDEGWRRLDDAAEVDSCGAPVDFPDLDRARHVALYAIGIDAACRADPRAGLLVSLHGQGLHEGRFGLSGPARPRDEQPPAVRAFISSQEALRSRLRAEIDAGAGMRDWEWAGYRLLQALDVLSLYIIWFGLPRAAAASLPAVPRHSGDPGVEIRVTPLGPDAFACEPYPFASDEVTFPVRARAIEKRRYRDHDDLRAALAQAPPVTIAGTARRA